MAKTQHVGRRSACFEFIMPTDPVHQFNPSACEADFTYTMTPVAVEIQNTGKGKKAVADDLDAVLRKIEYWRQGSTNLRR